jgi:hypothetical protein
MIHHSLWSDNTPDDEYFRSLGEFVHSFTKTETMLFWYCGFLAGLSPDASAVLIREVRTNGLIDLAKALTRMKPQPSEIEAEQKRIFDHLAAINTFRTGLIHFMPAESKDFGRVVIDPRIPSYKPPKVRRVNADTLKGVIFDLFVIGLCLQALSIAFVSNSPNHLAATKRSDQRMSDPWRFDPPAHDVELPSR